MHTKVVAHLAAVQWEKRPRRLNVTNSRLACAQVLRLRHDLTHLQYFNACALKYCKCNTSTHLAIFIAFALFDCALRTIDSSERPHAPRRESMPMSRPGSPRSRMSSRARPARSCRQLANVAGRTCQVARVEAGFAQVARVEAGRGCCCWGWASEGANGKRDPR